MVYWKPMDNLALYLHIPFCSSRCTYCDFFTSTGREDWIPDYVEALTAELDYLSRSVPEEIGISSVFLGGGTPSLLLSSQVQQLLQAVRDGFHLFPDAEITLEANPESVSQPYLGEIFLAGVNRLSLGMQTSDPDQLRLLGRRHDFPEVEEAVRGARRVGFENLNLDLIYGIPGGTVASWRDTLNAALDLEPEHLSLYGLTLEEGTPLADQVKRGLVPDPNPDWAAELIDQAAGKLRAAGYRRYEIANWAKPGRTCRHNLTYWTLEPYLGVGAGAHGLVNGVRTENTQDWDQYTRCWADPPEKGEQFPVTPAAVRVRKLDRDTEMDEYLIMGLRLTEKGVSAQAFSSRFGRDLEEVYGQSLGELLDWDLLAWEGDSLRLTPRAVEVANQVFSRLLR